MSSGNIILGTWIKPGGSAWAGNLIIRDDSTIELEVLSNDFSAGLTHHDFIHGYTGQDLYTLKGLVNYSSNIGMGSSVGTKQLFYVDFAIKGIHLEDADQRFPRFSFSIEGLQDWTRFTGITSVKTQAASDPRINRNYTHEPPQPVEIEVGELSFRLIPVLSEPNKPWTINLTEDTQIHVTSASPMTISEWLTSVVFPFRRLVQLSVKTGGTLQRLGVSRKLQDTRGGARDPDWYSLLTSYGGEYPFLTTRSAFEKLLLQLDDFEANPVMLDGWFKLEKKFREPIEAVLDSALGEPTPEYVLFVYSRLLERLVSRYPQSELCDEETMSKIVDYAKSVVPGEKGQTLGKKIGSQRRSDAKVPLIAALSKWTPVVYEDVSEEEIDWIASKIITTRNHFAHQNSGKPPKLLIKPEEMQVFTALVQVIVDLELIDQLGFDHQTIVPRLADSRRWRNAEIVHECWTDYVQANSAKGS